MKYKSRATRFDEALEQIDDGSVEGAQMDIQELRDELQSWLDNLPENLQNGTKADQLQDAIDELDDIDSELQTIIDSINDLKNRTVEFPGMY